MGELTSNIDVRNRPTVTQTQSKDNLVGIASVTKIYYQYTTEDGVPISPGNIKVRFVSTSRSKDVIAYPFQESMLDLPIEGELVEVFDISNKRYYRRIQIDSQIGRDQQEQNTNPLIASPPSNTLTSFSNPSVSTNTNRNSVNVDKQEGTKTIHRLALSKGDILIQSRFGQSIRLSSFAPDAKTSNPILTIRNRESEKASILGKSVSIREDINFDGSTIAMSSGKYIVPFTPGTPDDSGKTNFELDVRKKTPGPTPPYGFESYPSQLDGDQIIITSNRLVFSSRTAETIFWAKGQTGFITDSVFTVDALKGMTLVSHKGNIDIEAKDKNVNINVGQSGKIFLGTGQGKTLVPAADTEGLLNILGEILDEMENLCNGGILTPSGPSTGINPANRSSIAALRDRLASLQSKTVYIAK